MNKRGAPEPTIDTNEFARLGASVHGAHPGSGFARLRDLLATDRGELRWTLSGERRRRPEGGHDDFLALTLEGELDLVCTRCLQPLGVKLDEQRLFRLFASEAQALRADAEVDDYDALVSNARLDPLVLVEDEALLALPIAPRHHDCSVSGEANAGIARDRDHAGEAPADEERPNPFAVLARIRRDDRQR